MAINRKPVTKPAEPHPFESFGTPSGADVEALEPQASGETPGPTRSSVNTKAEPTKAGQPTRPSRRGRGSDPAKTADQAPDPLVTRTYRIPQSYDDRLQHGSLLMGMRRGYSVNKSDLVREAVDEYLTKHKLDD